MSQIDYIDGLILMLDENRYVMARRIRKEEALGKLEIISGVSFGYDQDAWRDYFKDNKPYSARKKQKIISTS